MEIKFSFRGNHYAISIGHKTMWFEQLPFIIVQQEYYNSNKQVEYAKILWQI